MEKYLPYQQLDQISDVLPHQRIFSPFGYRLVRETQTAPIVHSEAMQLAPWFPIVWSKDSRGSRLVALRSLLDGARGIAEDAARNLDALPLILFAYPFAVRDQADVEGGTRLALDRTMCDEPTDAGASIYDTQGAFTKGARLRIDKLMEFYRLSSETETFSQALEQRELLEPWSVEIDLGTVHVSIKNLFCISPPAFERSDLAGVVDSFGAPMAELIAAHRLSLYRINWLRASARRAIATPPSQEQVP